MLSDKKKIEKINKLYNQFIKRTNKIRDEILLILIKENKKKDKEKIKEIKDKIND